MVEVRVGVRVTVGATVLVGVPVVGGVSVGVSVVAVPDVDVRVRMSEGRLMGVEVRDGPGVPLA
jgi:hypothetical protein